MKTVAGTFVRPRVRYTPAAARPGRPSRWRGTARRRFPQRPPPPPRLGIRPAGRAARDASPPHPQAAAVAAPQIASADGAVSAATVERSRGIYGGRIADLKDAVEKGDFAAVLAEKNAFDLFNSGAYAQKSAITKAQKAIAVTETKNIMEAIASKREPAQDVAAYMKNAAIDTKPVDVSTGQGYSNDYDWKVRTKKAPSTSAAARRGPRSWGASRGAPAARMLSSLCYPAPGARAASLSKGLESRVRGKFRGVRAGRRPPRGRPPDPGRAVSAKIMAAF
ncbi:xanthine dehydrogenase [Aureococcus anophagefferens]|nr:xanthine dehydrogenase [Aureococcus anophagefferens]